MVWVLIVLINTYATIKELQMLVNISAQQFIEKASAKHVGAYQYDKVVFINNSTPVTITCPKHGDFSMTPTSHKFGYGCAKCGRERTKAGQLKSNQKTTLTTQQFVDRAISVHGNTYDYSNTVYSNWTAKVDIACSTHGVFKQAPGKHIDLAHPTGCPKCANKQQTTDDFIKKSQLTHGDLYDYSNSVYVNDITKITITCKEHGDFTMLPSNHHSLGQGCKQCALIKAQENIGYYAEHLFATQPERKTEPATLYYVRMTSDTETFYKVGLTKREQTHKRFYGVPYTIDIIETVSGTLYELWQREQSILQTVNKYKPHNKFNGWTECFSEPLKLTLFCS